jgi:ABC-type transporter MlaC component
MKRTLIALALILQPLAHANPTESVSSTIGKLMTILAGANEVQKVSQLCRLVRSDLETASIGLNLLGTFQHLSTDAEGVRDFKALVPSIIMDQFYGLLNDKGGSEFSIGGTVPKGSGRVGVKVVIAGSNFIVTVLRSNNKIVDVEWNNYSLVNTKRDEFQRDLSGFHTDKPVSALVNRLNNNGVNKCR